MDAVLERGVVPRGEPDTVPDLYVNIVTLIQEDDTKHHEGILKLVAELDQFYHENDVEDRTVNLNALAIVEYPEGFNPRDNQTPYKLYARRRKNHDIFLESGMVTLNEYIQANLRRDLSGTSDCKQLLFDLFDNYPEQRQRLDLFAIIPSAVLDDSGRLKDELQNIIKDYISGIDYLLLTRWVNGRFIVAGNLDVLKNRLKTAHLDGYR